MGTAPPSKPLKEPARPFKREQRKTCLQHTFLPKPRKDPTVLLHLISRREWQKVLIRVTLFPSEVTARQKMTWYGVQWSLIPLHLACALQPPAEVIRMLLRFHSDTARVRMNRSALPPSNNKKRKWRRKNKMKKKLAPTQDINYNLYSSNRGGPSTIAVPKIDTAPSTSSDENIQQDDRHLPHLASMETEKIHNHASSDSGSLLEDEAFAMKGDDSLHVFETYDDDSTDSEEQKHESSIAVHAMPPEMLPDYDEVPAPEYATRGVKTKSFPNKHGVALQLSANGCLEPLAVTDENAIHMSKMHWNLDPLLMEADALLPLHIACLYRASPAVISALLEAYPKAAQDAALGMLPIHMVCAGFDLPPPLLAPPPGPVPFPHDDEFNLVESIRRLESAFPESVDYPSENNGMSPKTYIDETLDDGAFKDACLEALGVEKQVSLEEEEEVTESKVSEFDNTTLTTRVPDEVHCEDDNSTLPSYQTEATSSRYLGQDCLPQINGSSGSRLYSQMLNKDWAGALATIEERPKDARKWQYGIELDRIETLDSAAMWKRLPIHSACVLHAPIGVIDALIWAYPKGICTKDPFSGSLPLHLACRHSAPPELVKCVVMAYPTASRIEDMVGRLPLHMACLSGASRLTFIYLLKAFPHAVILKDDRRMTPLQYAQRNPTLKPETVELLELVHQFLEKQPAVEDDYTFDGFSTPRSIHGSDDGSTVSGFYEDTLSAFSRQSPRVDGSLDGSPSSQPQLSQEERNVERLAEQFSHILDAADEDDFSGRITPKFGVSLAKKESEKSVVNDETSSEDQPSVEEADTSDEISKAATEADGAASTLAKLVSLHDKSALERPADISSTIAGDSDVVADAPMTPDEAKGAAVTLSKLVLLQNKRDTNPKTSIRAGLLTKELSRILEEGNYSGSDEESQTQVDSQLRRPLYNSPENSYRNVKLQDTEESPLDRLSKLLSTSTNSVEQYEETSVCLDGDDPNSSDTQDDTNSTNAATGNSHEDEVEGDEGQHVSGDDSMRQASREEVHEVPQEEPIDASSSGDEMGKAMVDDTDVVSDSEVHHSDDDVDNTGAKEEKVYKSSVDSNTDAIHDHDKSEARTSSTSTPRGHLHDDTSNERPAIRQVEEPVESVIELGTSSINDVETVLAKQQPNKSDEKTGVDQLLKVDQKQPKPIVDPPALMGFAPADVAAGCSPLTSPLTLPETSPLTLPKSESTISVASSDTTVVTGSSKSKAAKANVAEYVAIEDDDDDEGGASAYKPLVNEVAENETTEISADPNEPGGTLASGAVALSTTLSTSDQSIPNHNGNTVLIVGKSTRTSLVKNVPLDNEIGKASDKPPSDGASEELQEVESKSDTNADSDIVTPMPKKAQEPALGFVQQRDDSNKTSSPKQEERLDVSP